ncbi:MAG: two-component system response regulator [Omnitrophica WOR_2 bacterium RIFCSPLOWO2_12_FULL_50_9]|nr:MAG: two-component system response regulator [Omnitrophica WOR_2 bacterium RIFCSPHIGHO2_02_FULL_50_17]OGX41521.1 MAG: two-component system response regulator [Omnitrophica WOR_2 bacterium RIFCSPLOWO2_12_FULL_50_9]
MAGRILIVDDAPIIRLMLKDILVANGYEVVGEGSDGNEGVQKYKELKPDVVTMDITMPEKDGIQALEEILAMDEDAKVIVITAIDQREALMEAIRVGAADYIIKPFETDRVLSAIRKVFGEG